jgi:hypothetical protein
MDFFRLKNVAFIQTRIGQMWFGLFSLYMIHKNNTKKGNEGRNKHICREIFFFCVVFG